MTRGLRTRRIWLSVFTVITFLPSAVGAKDFVSSPYGFQISLPAGYREQRAAGNGLIAEFVEPQSEVGGYPITVDLRHPGADDIPVNATTVTDLPQKRGWTSSIESRHWKDLDLQVLRQDTVVSSSEKYVNYTVIFPLVDKAIIVVVQGQTKREPEVLRVFDACVRDFVNLKPYVNVTENANSLLQMLPNVLLPVVTGAIVIFLFAKVRKARSKPV